MLGASSSAATDRAAVAEQLRVSSWTTQTWNTSRPFTDHLAHVQVGHPAQIEHVIELRAGAPVYTSGAGGYRQRPVHQPDDLVGVALQ
jgi:hypothetical protein